jgi:hypothetical protein
MIKIYCDYCKDEIRRSVLPYELKKWNRHFCDKECRLDFERSTGHFKAMSLAGRAGRQRVMPVSNKEKPRRQKNP